MFGRIPILTYHSTLGTIHDQSASGWNPNQTISHSSFSAQLGLLRKNGGRAVLPQPLNRSTFGSSPGRPAYLLTLDDSRGRDLGQCAAQICID
jgi:hypothetical protein